jgi:hypothetical protein
LLSRFRAQLANPISGVCSDLLLRTLQRDLDLFDRSRQLVDTILEVGGSRAGAARSASSIHHAYEVPLGATGTQTDLLRHPSPGLLVASRQFSGGRVNGVLARSDKIERRSFAYDSAADG